MEDLGPFTLANSHSHDFVAKSNGQSYRVWVATSAKRVPGEVRPTLYTLDGNGTFGTVAETARFLAFAGELPPIIVVGIGYPGAGGLRDSMVLRNFELTPTTDHDYIERAAKQNQPMGPNGHAGADGFLEFITQELAPAVEDQYGGDPNDRALSGFSLGGLFTAYALLQQPLAFQRFVVGSPSFWWDNRVIFEMEAKRAEGPKSLPARVFVSAGEQEQAVGGPLIWARMVTNAHEFAAVVASRAYDGLEIEHQTILNVGHQQPPMLVQGLTSVYRRHPGIVRPRTP